MRMIHLMDIYSLIFYAPAVQTATTASAMIRLAGNGSLTNYRSSSGMALQLSSLMSDLLCLQLQPGPMEVTYPYAVMPHALLCNFMPAEKKKKAENVAAASLVGRGFGTLASCDPQVEETGGTSI